MTGLREAALAHQLRRGVHRGCRLLELLVRDQVDRDFDAFAYLRVVARRSDADGAAARLVLDHLVAEADLPSLDDELLGVAALTAGADRTRAA